jgi:hypothetical protein
MLHKRKLICGMLEEVVRGNATKPEGRVGELLSAPN